MRQDLPYHALIILLALCALAFAASLLPGASPPIRRVNFVYAQGYFASLPRLGRARIVPLARSALKNPAADSAVARPDAALANQNDPAY